MTDFPYFRKGLPGAAPSVAASKALPVVRTSISNPEKYIVEPGLAHAINVALLLGRPLLLTGDPGVGKTDLAKVIAHELRETADGPDLPVHKFETNSASAARDLFYTYDAIAAFRSKDAEQDARWFITLQALGLAIVEAFEEKAVAEVLPKRADEYQHNGPRRAVVLIDEIDKAPRDFPNDILNQIERLYFRIPEFRNIATPGAGDRDFAFPKDKRPIVVITSNAEKTLPDPFIRRCIYYHIDRPAGPRLREIVAARLSDIVDNETSSRNGAGTHEAGRDLVETAIAVFEKLVEMRIDSPLSTAELLDWIQVLAHRIGGSRVTTENQHVLTETLPALVKQEEDLKAARRAIAEVLDPNSL